jgi:hypothetical protein
VTEESRLLAQALAILPVFLLGLLGFAVVQRYRRRPVPAWLGWVGVFFVGLGLGPGVLLGTAEPAWLLTVGVPVVIITWMLVRSGRLRWAGFFLVGLGTPGILWLVLPQVRAAIPVQLLTPDTRLVWLAPACVMFMGLGLVIVGDHVGAKPRIMATPAGLARDPMMVGHELYGAIAFGPVTLPGLVSEGIGFGALALGIPLLLSAGLSWFLVIPAGAAAFMLIATEGWYLALPRDLRRAWEGFSAVGHPEQERWEERTGERVPNTAARIKAWLRDHEPQPGLFWAHAELLAFVGRLDEAREVAARIEPADASEAHELQALADYLDWLGGGDLDIDGLARTAEGVGEPGSRERLEARARVAIALARHRADTGGDWRQPLLAIREEAGPKVAARWFRQDTRPMRLVSTFLLGLLLSTVITLSVLSFPG